jgi:hypothetical protein
MLKINGDMNIEWSLQNVPAEEESEEVQDHDVVIKQKKVSVHYYMLAKTY